MNISLISKFTLLLALYSGHVFSSSPSNTADTINGEQPPGIIAKAKESLLIHQDHPTGNDIVIMKTSRPKGTRTPIHQHPSAGTTCVLAGEMTLFLEGSPPQKAVAGTCYAMPKGKNMSGVNTGESDAVMMDIFFTPKGGELWEIVDPHHQNHQDQFVPPVKQN